MLFLPSIDPSSQFCEVLKPCGTKLRVTREGEGLAGGQVSLWTPSVFSPQSSSFGAARASEKVLNEMLQLQSLLVEVGTYKGSLAALFRSQMTD